MYLVETVQTLNHHSLSTVSTNFLCTITAFRETEINVVPFINRWSISSSGGYSLGIT